MKEINILNKDRVLIIAPHPDDESIGMGGFLAKFAQQTDVWLLTDGCMGGSDGQTHMEVAQIRNAEFEKAMKMAGVRDYRIFKIKDRDLSTKTDLLKGEILESYNKIFVTNANDSHPDHVAAFLALGYALERKKDDRLNAEIYQYEVTTPLSMVTHYLDITDIVEKKKELIGIYSSQIQQADYYSISLSLNQFRASVYGKRNHFVETYRETNCFNEFDQSANERLMLVRQREKLDYLLECYDKWMHMEMFGKHISYVIEHDLGNKIWIYGCGLLGRAIYRAVVNKVHVVGFLDKFVSKSDETAKEIWHPDDVAESDKDYPVIVSVVFEYESIEEEMRERGYKKIISFDSLLEGNYKK